MELNLEILKLQERASLQLRVLYEQAGYRKYHMGRFEEYGLYQENQRFLSSEQVITFTDLDGRLLALKPDVTLSIAKNAQIAPGQCQRYYYSENVYRPSLESHTFREISQMGLECMGEVDDAATAQVVSLAIDSLAITGADFVLELSHMGFVTGLLDAVGAPESVRPRLLECVRSKNVQELQKCASGAGLSRQGIDALRRLSALSGDWKEVLAAADELALNAAMGAALSELNTLCTTLEDAGKTGNLKLDLSLVNDIDYYNGLVLQGYLAGLPRAVLKGGRYDPLIGQFTPGARAIGFALYLDEMERLNAPEPPVEQGGGKTVMLNVALPKGRLGDKVYDLLAGVGYGCPENYNDTRKLVVENPKAGIRYFLVKPSDVAIYVEHGAADIGIVGKDILEESGADVYELLDTGLGKCRMCVAGPKNFEDDPGRSLRVATKFVNIAKAYYAAQGRDIDIIKLNGSIELAPILGLSDVIVDIVETGTTLKENNLKVLTEFMPISARFIANKASYQFKNIEIETLLGKLAEVTEHDQNS
ncbi:MAG: ATP phosphoribosyltransferase [Oscillibacter sp.]|jgi:ATP phosphoribosyltransferase regulatory subunit|nr:ATP phosphoribosyltransferase [Oscillibacter sp.]